MRISVQHDFERRLGIFPAEFGAGGQLHENREIRGMKEIVLRDLNADFRDCLSVDAFNDSGCAGSVPGQ